MRLTLLILFAAATASHAAVTVAWDPDQPTNQIVGYVVTATKVSSGEKPVAAITEKTSHTFTLAPGNYVVSVRVIGTSGQMSEAANSGEFRVIAAAEPLGEIVIESKLQQAAGPLGPWTDIEVKKLTVPQTATKQYFRGTVTTTTNAVAR